MKSQKTKLKVSLNNLTLNKETILELSTNQMNGIVGGNPKPTELNCLSLQGPPLCDPSNNTNCYSACQGGCDDTFGCGVWTASTDCSSFC